MDFRIEQGLARHFASFERRLAQGERRLGFKVAFNPPAVQARLGIAHCLVGGLTATTLHGAGPYALQGRTRMGLEAEVAVFLGADIPPEATAEQATAAVSAIAPAIELVEVNRPLEELTEILAEGVFHRAVALGQRQPPPPGASLTGLLAAVRHNDTPIADVDAGEATGALPPLLLHLARLLHSFGQGLLAGDVVIAGAMVPPVTPAPGDRFSVRLAGQEPVSMTFN